MPSRSWVAAIALGLVAGVGISLLFLAWAVPEFRNPTYQNIAQEPASQQDAGKETSKTYKKPEWRYWAERFIGLEDTPAQWLMAFFAVLATGVSIYAIRLLKQTLDATREVGRDQSRAYLHVDGIDFFTGGRVGSPTAIAWIKNTGETPAKWFYLVGTANLYPIDYTIPFAIEADETENPGVTWNALGGGDQLSAPIRIGDNVAAKTKAAATTGENHLLLVSGFVRYETFFAEVFETEFMFVCRPLPSFKSPKLSDRQIAAIQKGLAIYRSGEEPHKMQRAGRRLSSYKYVNKPRA